MTIEKYKQSFVSEWNQFIDNSKNGTFLLKREYMEYHSDRFHDYSLVVFNQNKIVAVLPANLTKENILFSHQGLTYGGLIISKTETLKNTLEYFYLILRYLNEQGIVKLKYKLVPSIYHQYPSDEVEYALFYTDANLYRRDIGFIIDLNNKLPYQERRKRSIKKAIKSDIKIIKESSFESFWNKILIPNLFERFGINPVHSLQEIELLSARFPEKIIQYSAYQNDEIVAGTTLYINNDVVHSQYISTSDKGRDTGAIDYLFSKLIEDVFPDKKVFSLGIVNENEGREINNGLLDWKEGFGARAVSHSFYEIETENYKKLDSLINKKNDQIS